ncbi:hypothetical protein KKH86_00415 [Patescibacteria group bacterium]|nr:hypothetical protein [Patescibacteria group bacterium]
MFKKVFIFAMAMAMAIGAATVEVEAKSPYHSMNAGSYQEVKAALEKPSWLAAYVEANFQYKYDIEQFGKSDYWQSAEEFFDRGLEGDCEDLAPFIEDVLVAHGIPAELWYVSNNKSAHAIAIFPYKGKWTYMDTAIYVNETSYLQHPLFNTKDEAVKDFYGETHKVGFEISPSWFLYETEKVERINMPSKGKDDLRGDNRLPLEMHLTEEIEEMQYSKIIQYNFAMPEDNLEMVHKGGVGYLQKVGNVWFGGSITAHGFYAPVLSECNWKYTLYFVLPRVGISFYEGDYTGMDADIKILDYKHLKFYSCFRNFDEIIDLKAKIIVNQNFFLKSIKLEKVDKEFVYGANFQVGFLGIGISSNQVQLKFGSDNDCAELCLMGYLLKEKRIFFEGTLIF